MESEKVIEITDRARAKALAVRDEERDPHELALFLEVLEPMGGEYTYDLYFDLERHARPGDVVQRDGDLAVVILADSVDKLRGATLDLSRNLLAPGWVVKNPNSPSPAVRGGPVIPPEELTGDTAQKVQQVLELAINPAIASHGGRAELVAVEGGTVYVRLEGGCQGCGMASVTLTQGIEVAIRDSIPEIERVLDVTDHAAGESPYYEAAKK